MTKGGCGGTFGGDLYPKPLGCERPLLPFALLKRRGQQLEAQALRREPAAQADLPVQGVGLLGHQHAPAGPAAGEGRLGGAPPVSALEDTCQAHDLLACASCKRLWHTAGDCCQRGHHAAGHVVRRPMIERCSDHSLPACLVCARHQCGVRHCCPRHHKMQDSGPGRCSGPQSSAAKRMQSASPVSQPEVADKKRRQQAGGGLQDQRVLIDLTFDEATVSGCSTRVRRWAAAKHGDAQYGAYKRARTVQPVWSVSSPAEAQRHAEPGQAPSLLLRAPPGADPAPSAPPPRAREGGGGTQARL